MTYPPREKKNDDNRDKEHGVLGDCRELRHGGDLLQEGAKLTKLKPADEATWREHFLNDHLPHRRDCRHCVQAQARSKPHPRLVHASAYTLSVDMSGRMKQGEDQHRKRAKYLLIGTYTFPVDRNGRPMAGWQVEEEDHDLPPEDWKDVGDGDAQPMPMDDLLLEEDVAEIGEVEEEDKKRYESGVSAMSTWEKMVVDAKDFGIKTLTFVEVVSGRTVPEIIPAIASMYAQLRSLGLPILRLHADRAREFVAAPLRRWTLDRQIIQTFTSGSTYKENGRVEAEVGVIKRAIKTTLVATKTEEKYWPLVARHVGRRRLLQQLQRVGWEAPKMLPFGTPVFALRKSWQEMYHNWRTARVACKVMGISSGSSLTATMYYVQAEEDGKFFVTGDVVHVEAADDPQERLEDRAVLDEVPAQEPLQQDGPRRRLHQKTAPPRVEGGVLKVDVDICHSIDGQEERTQTHCKETEEEKTYTHLDRSTEAADDVMERWEEYHRNITEYIQEEMQKVDVTSEEGGAYTMKVLAQMCTERFQAEEQMREVRARENEEAQQLEEFLTTRTVPAAEVYGELEMWRESIEKEYNQLVNETKAVIQMTRKQLLELAEKRGETIETLPAKMVFTRKAHSGLRRSRAVCCGNFAQDDPDQAVYASGCDAVTTRMTLRTAALKHWDVAGVDIKTAFLQAPRREDGRLIMCEVPQVMRRLGMAKDEEVWLISKALYGLTTSPRDWSVSRDQKLPQIKWKVDGCYKDCHFEATAEENLWLVKASLIGKEEVKMIGALLVYVDDFLVMGEKVMIGPTLEAIAGTWKCSEAQIATETSPVHFCGVEIRKLPEKSGLVLSQDSYEREMLEKWKITGTANWPQFKTPDPEAEVEKATAEQVKEAQAMCGALLWLSTRTRPELTYGVHIMAKNTTKRPLVALEVGKALMKYLKGNKGGLVYGDPHYNGAWGARDQLMVKRHERLLEVFSDISFATAANFKSTGGAAIFYGGALVAWSSSTQPFITQSTAEAELLGSSESFSAGRATIELVKILGEKTEDKDGLQFAGVLYGDNSAAVAMTSGTSGTSWRTRHLKIRATALKELLDRECWQLRHLKGSELVADGFTKGLTGAAWQRYCQDLGVRIEPKEAIQEQQDVAEKKVTLAKAAIGVGGLLVGYGYGQHNARGKYLQAVGAMVMSVGVLTLQQMNQWPGSSMRSLRTTSSTSGENVEKVEIMDDQETTSGTSSSAWFLETRSTARAGGSEEPEDVRPRLCVLRERSRSRDDRDGPPRNLREVREEGSQDPTEPEESPMAEGPNPATGSGGAGGEASASAAAGGAASSAAAAERTRRNEEMADLTSESNVAVYGRDSGIAADTVMMGDEEWSVHSGREVEFDLQLRG